MRQSHISNEKEIINKMNDFILKYLMNKMNKVAQDGSLTTADAIREQIIKFITNTMFEKNEQWPALIEYTKLEQMAWTAYASHSQILLYPIQVFVNVQNNNQKTWDQLYESDVMLFLDLLQTPDKYNVNFRYLIKAFNIAAYCAQVIHHWVDSFSKEELNIDNVNTWLGANFRSNPMFQDVASLIDIKECQDVLAVHPNVLKWLASNLCY